MSRTEQKDLSDGSGEAALVRTPEADTLSFTDLFDLDEIQTIQDAFSAATGVASIITRPDGTPITSPSNFCRLCIDVIRGTDVGRAHCLESDAFIGRPNRSGPVIRPCLSGGLWDAGASISAGGQHVANWLIGQVRNEEQDDEALLTYADEIGVDREVFAAALAEVPSMPLESFELIAQMLFLFSNELSVVAYQKLEQERLLAESESQREALRASESRLAALFQNAPLGYQSLDEEGRFIEVNEAWLELLGYTREEVVGRWFGDFLAPEFRDAFRERFPLFKARGAIHSEFQMIHKDGSRHAIAFEGRIGYNPDGSFKQTHCILSDITEKQRSEAELRRTQERLQGILDNTPALIYVKDLQGQLTLVNKHFAQLFGAPGDELVGKTDHDLMAAETAATRWANDLAVIASGEPITFEEANDEADGPHTYLSVKFPLFDSEGGVQEVCGISTDITDRVRAEEEVVRQVERVGRALESVIEIARDIVEERDPYTAGHQRRVSDIAVRIAADLGLSEAEVEEIRVASLLHDVGKVAVPSEILSKPGAISPMEYELLKTHAEAGHRILMSASMDEPLPEMVYQHHERLDGSGYPRKLVADQILPAARIIAVADVVEAMMSHRPYRPALGLDAALAEIERGAGTVYDPDVVRACVALFREHGFELT